MIYKRIACFAFALVVALLPLCFFWQIVSLNLNMMTKRVSVTTQKPDYYIVLCSNGSRKELVAVMEYSRILMTEYSTRRFSHLDDFKAYWATKCPGQSIRSLSEFTNGTIRLVHMDQLGPLIENDWSRMMGEIRLKDRDMCIVGNYYSRTVMEYSITDGGPGGACFTSILRGQVFKAFIVSVAALLVSWWISIKLVLFAFGISRKRPEPKA